MHGDHRKTSDLLLDIVRTHHSAQISVRELIDALEDRGFGFVMLLFGLGSTVPVPGVATLFGVPLMLFALQMVARYRKPWLPARLADRGLARADVERVVLKGTPLLRRVERLCKPRFDFLIGPVGEQLLGVLIFILALVISLPGPLTNGPPGIAIVILSIAMIERDGLAVLAGIAASGVALALGLAGLAAFAYIAWAGVHSLF